MDEWRRMEEWSWIEEQSRMEECMDYNGKIEKDGRM